mgnify:CR=1 FL=1
MIAKYETTYLLDKNQINSREWRNIPTLPILIIVKQAVSFLNNGGQKLKELQRIKKETFLLYQY